MRSFLPGLRTRSISRVGALLLAGGLLAQSAGSAAATSYQGYSGDFVAGPLSCIASFGDVAATDPSYIQIAGDNPALFGEEQTVYTTSMLYRWSGSEWVSASNWSNWRMTTVNDAVPNFNVWKEWNGSSWVPSYSLGWSNLSHGYYAVINWMYFQARPGVVGPGWAYSWSSDGSYCQV